MKIVLTLILALCWTPAFACIHSVEITETYATVCAVSDSCRTLDYVDLPPGGANKKTEFAQQYFQDFLDTRLTLASFPPEDPDKAENPACENFFWSDIDGQVVPDVQATHMTARGCVIENITWDGVTLNWVVRRADRCP